VLFESPAAASISAVAEAHSPLVLKKLASRGIDQQALQPKLTAWLLSLADAQPIAVLIDDLHALDDASLSLVASLALAAARRRLIVVATLREGARPYATDAFAAMQRACARFELHPLGRHEVEVLVCSLFGDVPNLALLCDRLYQAAAGNIRETLDIAQMLIARRVLRYEGGQWLLPEALAQDALPSSATELCRARLAELSPLARELAEVHALASHPTLSRQDYARVADGVAAADVDEAISELVAGGLLVGDSQGYGLATPEWIAALEAGLSTPARLERHARLGDLYEGCEQRVIEEVRHCLCGGREARAIDLLVPRLMNATSSVGILALTSMSAQKVAEVLDRALEVARELGRTPREIHDIRRGVFAISVVTDEARYFRVADALLAQLKRDSGLTAYEGIADATDPMQRLMRALTQAKEAYDAAPEHERVLAPEAAIKGVAYYTAISIAVGSRAQDHARIASLPSLLEPFAALSPLLHAMWQNAIATRESICDNRAEHARARWIEVDAKLATVTSTEMSYVQVLRGAIAYGIALIEARLGVKTAEARSKVLDDDPMQRASAMSLRRIARLHRGDVVGAERYRKQAELIALHANQRQMFTSTLVAELIAHANAGDLAGIRASSHAIAAQAERFPGWLAFRHLAEGYFELARDSFEAALAAFEHGLKLARPNAADPSRATGAWLRLEAARMEALLGLGRADEARAAAREVLGACTRLEIGAAAFVVRRVLSLTHGQARRLRRRVRRARAVGRRGQGARHRGPRARRDLRGPHPRRNLDGRPRRGGALRPADGARISLRPRLAAGRALRAALGRGARCRRDRATGAAGHQVEHDDVVPAHGGLDGGPAQPARHAYLRGSRRARAESGLRSDRGSLRPPVCLERDRLRAYGIARRGQPRRRVRSTDRQPADREPRAGRRRDHDRGGPAARRTAAARHERRHVSRAAAAGRRGRADGRGAARLGGARGHRCRAARAGALARLKRGRAGGLAYSGAPCAWC